MTELDRERVGQTLRTAVSALIEGRPGALGRAQAQRAVDFEEPEANLPRPEPADVAPPLALIPPGPLPQDRGDKGPLQFRLGASLQVVRYGSEFAFAPGATGSVEWTPYSFRPRVWLTLMEFLSHTYNAPPPAYAASFRAGVGATVPALPWLQVDLGAGLDWLRQAPLPDGSSTSVYRLAVRFGPTDWFRIRSSLTLSLEHLTTRYFYYGGNLFQAEDQAFRWRPGLTIELWWL
jgi:hypothetical protein